MTNDNEQDGQQPPIPICRKFLWGTCTKYNQCRFRHDLDIEEMKQVLKFCHDYQNKTGCKREDCTYLHATKEEQSLFLDEGTMPRVLADRHAAIAAAANTSESFVTAPPSLPVPTAAPAPAQVMAQGMLQPMQPTVLPTISVTAPPPPPPPPPPPTCANSVYRAPNPLYHAPPPQSAPVMYPPDQPAHFVPVFDASRPPPPLPPHCGLHQQNGTAKRRAADNCEVGSNKNRRIEEPATLLDDFCDVCVQRRQRIEMYNQECNRLRSEEKYQKLVYKKKLEEYELSRELLKSLVSPALYRMLDEYIEGGSQTVQPNDMLAQFSQISESSTVPRQFLLQLMNLVLDSTTSSFGVDDSLLQALSSTTRRTPSSSSNSDIIPTILELLVNSNVGSQSESRTNELTTEMSRTASSSSATSGANGYPFSNCQSASSSASRQNVAGGQYSSRLYPGLGVPGPSGLCSNATQMPQTPQTPQTPLQAPAYPLFHPAIPPPPPPNRTYYAQPMSTSTGLVGANSMPYGNIPDRMGGLVGHQQMRPSSSCPQTTGLLPTHTNGQNTYGADWRLPHNYYPPYQ